MYHREHENLKQLQLKVYFEKKFNTIIGRSTMSDILNRDNQQKIQNLPKCTRHIDSPHFTLLAVYILSLF